MNTGKLIPIIVTAGMLTTFVAYAEDNSAPPANDANEIFNSIMQTMPRDMKARVDSASVIQKSKKMSVKKIPVPSYTKQSVLKNGQSKNAGLDKLPDEVRQQVLKTMQEIEQQKIERMLEFKESKE